MYQEDLPSFLEVAQDLNMRRLSKGNKEGFNLYEERTEVRREATAEK